MKSREETHRAIRDNLKWLEVMEEGSGWKFVQDLNVEYIQANQTAISVVTSDIKIT